MTQSSLPARNSGLRVFSASLLSALMIMMPFVQLAAASRRSERAVNSSGRKGMETEGARSGADALFVNPPVAGPITATKTDSYTNSPGPAAPGDTITYTVDVTNTGVADAAAVAFSDTIDANTSFVPGSLKVSPLAIADIYSAEKNVPLSVGTPGVLTNDTGLPAPTAVPIAGGATAQSGTVTLNADGSFTYTPPNATFTGVDTFTYSVTNGQAPPNPGDAQGTVTINVDAAPEVTATTPTNGATDQATTTNVTVTFSEAVNVTGNWFTISCTSSGLRNVVDTVVTPNGSNTVFTINPTTDFTQAETCTVTIDDTAIADQDSNDPPDKLAADYVFSFTMDAAPSVSSTTPTNGATNVGTTSNITLNFSESVSLTAAPVTISCATSGAHNTYSVSGSPNTSFTINPTVDFVAGELCTVTVLAAQVSDTDANDPPNNMVANYAFSFTTDQAPTVTATTPTNGATNQTTNTDITLTFSESVSLTPAPVTISCTVSGAHNAYSVSASPNTVFTINPTVDFVANETCTVTVLANQVSDTDSGDPPDNLAANFIFNFSTDAAPAVTTVTPTNASTQVAANTNIVVNFSEPVNIVDATAFTVECPTGSPVAFSVTPAAPGASSSFTIDPTSDLPFNTICTVTVVASKVTDTDSNDPPDNMAANFIFSFTVDQVPTVTTTTPTNSSLSNLKSTNVTVNFSENVGVTAGGVTINCGAGNIAFSGLPQTNVASIVLDPTSDLPPGSTCTVTVLSANVTDSDAGDPPNNLDGDNNGSEGGNYVFTFGVAPDAVNDAYNSTGNVGIVIGAPGVLANDIGPGAVVNQAGTASANTAVPATVPTTGGGSVQIAADGSFTYLPPVGQATGPDTFKYRISNAGGVSTEATVTFTITNIVWFICDGCGGSNQGTLQNPYTSVFAFSDKNGDGAGFPAANQRLYIRSGTYDAANDNLTLLNGQIVSGQGQAATTFFTPEPNSPAAYAALTASTRPIIAPTGSAGNAVNLASGNSLTQFNLGSDVSGTCAAGSSPTNGTLLNSAVNVGALAISNMIINGCGRAINIPSGGTVGVVFDSVASRNSTTGGIVWNSSTPGGSVNYGPVTINNSTGVGIQMLSNAATFTLGNTNVSGSGGTGVELGGAGTGNSGTITFADLDISPDSGQRGLHAQQNSAAITTTSGDIITTSGVAVSISGVNSANKTPLNIQLTKVSATNASTGIVLTNTSSTGSPGGFRVLGTGGSCTTSANCTGGAITGSGATTYGVLLSGASDPSFDRMFIQNTTSSGVRGDEVTNFTFTNGVIDNSGTAGGSQESNIAFNDPTGSATNRKISGTVTITGNTLTNARWHGVSILQFQGTLDDVNISNNTLTSGLTTGAGGNSLGSGIQLVPGGTAAAASNLTRAELNNNTITNFPGGVLIAVQCGTSANSPAPTAKCGTVGSATNDIEIKNNILNGGGATVKPNQIVLLTVNGRGEGQFTVQNNGTIADPLSGSAGNIIDISAGGDVTVQATVTGNRIDAAGQTVGGTSGIVAGVGKFDVTGPVTLNNSTLYATINNNSVVNSLGSGIRLNVNEGSPDLHAIVKTNTVGTPLSGTYGIQVQQGPTTPGTIQKITNLEISANVSTGGSSGGNTFAGIGLRKMDTTVGQFAIVGLSPSPATNAQMETNVSGQNPASVGGNFDCDGAAPFLGVVSITCASSNWTSVASVPQPPALPLHFTSGGVEAASITSLSDAMLTDALGATASVRSISHSLTQAELDLVVLAAIERWSGSGLTAQQMATLRAMRFDVADLDGAYLGEAVRNQVTIDRDAGGKGWYTGSDPASDALFNNLMGETRRYADPFGAPAGRVDLLTALEHEMGHRLGLDDLYAEKDRDNLMYGYLTAGERRLPASGQAKHATLNNGGGSHFLSLAERDRQSDGRSNRKSKAAKALRPVSTASAPASGETINHTIGTLPGNKAVRITFQVTVDTPFLGPDQVSNQGSVTHSLAGSPVATDDPGTGTADDATITLVAGPPVANDDAYSAFKNSTLNIAAPGVLNNDTGTPTVSAVSGVAVCVLGSPCATTNGTVTLISDGSFSYTPTPAYTGPDSFTYTATNGQGSDTATVNITVIDTSAVYINEVMFDPTGTDAPNEYIELRGPASGLIPAGTYLVAIEGDAADNPGDVTTIINLSGLSFGSNGYLVLLQMSNTYVPSPSATVVTSTTVGFGGLPGSRWSADASATDLPDASVTFMLIQTGTIPTLTDDIDADDNGGFDGTVYPGWSVRDSISAMNASALARAYGAFSFRNTAGTGTGQGGEVIVPFIPSYVGRVCDSTGSTAADWVSSGVLGGLAPNWTLGSSTETEPPSFAGIPLDHIGTTNFVNSPPVNSVPVTQIMNEDATLTFSTGNGNLISVTDSDAAGGTLEVTLSMVAGQLTLSQTTGLVFSNGDGTDDTTMTFTGNLADINAALDGLLFEPTINDDQDDILTITVNDQGNKGGAACSTSQQDSDTVNITVNSVNDAPVLDNTGTMTLNSIPQDIPAGSNTGTLVSAIIASAGGDRITDVDAGAVEGLAVITVDNTNGTWEYSINGGANWFAIGSVSDDSARLLAADANTRIRFQPNAGMNGTRSITFRAWDQFSGINGGLADPTPAGGTTAFSTDTESASITVASTVSIQDAVVAEPPSGTASMIFTVTLNAPAGPSGASVNFTTADEPAGPGKAVAGVCGSGGDYVTTSGTVTFASGQQLRTISVPVCSDGTSEPDETFLVNLSGPVSATIGDGTATGTIKAANAAGTLLISEFRQFGPGPVNDPLDDFVEIYNNTNAPITVPAGGYGLFRMPSTCSATDQPQLIGTIPAGTIPARGHFLFTGPIVNYSLKDYGGLNQAVGNAVLTADLGANENFALFATTDVSQISSVNRFDAVGFGANNQNACDLLREGSTLTPLTVSPSLGQHSYFRKMCDWIQGAGCTVPGIPKDSNVNADDFWLADTAASAITGRLGAPGPENLTSPIRRDNATNPGLGGIDVNLLDRNIGSAANPNRERKGSDPAGTFGSMTLRYRVTNNTGGQITRLRYRIVDISTAIQPSGPTADLRGLTGVDDDGSPGNPLAGPVTDSLTCAGPTPCNVFVNKTTLEQPPTQTIGGGYNSTLSSGTITTGAPLNNGSSILINFKLGVEKTGQFRFYIIVEALP